MSSKYKKELCWLRDNYLQECGKLVAAGMSVAKAIRQLGIEDKFKAQFNHPAKFVRLAQWISRNLKKRGIKKQPSIQDKGTNSAGSSKKKKKAEIMEVFDKSQFILVTMGGGVSGFKTEEAMKDCIRNSSIIAGMKVFKAIPVDVKLDITLG